jgi:proteasome accessory factor B
VSVFVAQKALSQYHGTPFEKPLRSAFQKLVSSLQGEISVAWADLDSAISFRGIETNVGDMEVLRTLGEAVRGRREVEFEYFKLEEEGGGAASPKAETRRPKAELGEGGEGAPGLSGTGEMRRVRPYHLVCIWNQWYLVAYDLMRQDIRKFVPARMRNVRLRSERFERPKGFSVDKYLKGSFGVYSGGELMEMKVWFSRARAQVVRERKWHASQRIRELGNGEIEYSVRLSSMKEIVPWILGWGEHARAIAPKALVKAMRGVIGRLGELYDGTVPSGPVQSNPT